jgi:hypothetical protein
MKRQSGHLSFMTELPPLDDILCRDDYRTIYDAASLLKERVQNKTHQSAGVLTAARSLVETVCKTLLDLLFIEYDEKADLPDHSKLLLKSLDLNPSTKTVQELKQLCGGAVAMINSMAFLRSAHGDAHGSGEKVRSLPFRDAELAAYMACALTRYCIESFEAKAMRRGRKELTPAQEKQLIEVWLEIGRKHGMTNPDNLPYTEALEEIAQSLTQKTGIILSRKDIYLKLVGLRKANKLPKPKSPMDI